eukprot:CAMPEP_0174256468 /NCGR_PEP_ID=MMETSP0439-20130205/5695_1 /TAXON_ID=0 /ORGANISM="Stereomyxa ramosa, Strain Chinc5" /LENGTH=326 /DNA_ID=CAMNT_0015339087 /DNA_START=156 /DNA_END=1133 /DNA_ORIENTATION=+
MSFNKLIQSQEDSISFIDDKPTSAFPRNITDLFKGSWSKLDKPTVDDEEPFFSKAQRKKLLKEQSGHLIFHIINKPSPVPQVDIIEGGLVLRDGIWSTDHNMHFEIQGLYFWKTGDMFLLANPGSQTVVKDFSIDLNNDSTVAEAIAAVENIKTEEGETGCYFQILFKTKPVVPIQEEKKTATLELEKPKPTIDSKGIMQSPNCKLALTIDSSSIQFATYYRKATNYVIMVTLMSCIQIYVLIKQMESTSTQASAAKVSLLTIGAQAVMDSYLSLIHLTAGIVVESVFNPYATASFVKFVLFSFFEMSYLLLIFKARNPATFAAGW